MSPADEATAYELVRVRGLSYVAAGKQLGGLPKSTVRAAVNREAARRTPVGVSSADNALALAAPGGGDAAFVAALLGPTTQPPAPVAEPVADRLYVDDTPDETHEVLEFDAETIIRRQIKKVEAAIDELNTERNVGEAQKYTRALAGLVHDLRQIEKTKRDDDGVLTYTLADADDAIKRLDARARSVEEQPFVCAECGRAMRRKEAEEA